MSHANHPPLAPLATAAPPPEVLRGLDATDADRPAREVLSAVVWEGSALDPDTMKARDFLAQL